jgi:hypothetical protein
VHADLGDELFYTLLCDWPALRQTAFVWWQNGAAPGVKLPLIAKLFVEGGLVDDAAKMDATIAIVSARLPNSKFVTDQIKIVLDNLDQKSLWGLYAKIWLLSKYGTADELMHLIETTASLWVLRSACPLNVP